MAIPESNQAQLDGSAAFVIDNDLEPIRKKNRFDLLFAFAICWFGVVVLVAIFADLLPLPEPSAIDGSAGLQGPSGAHWLGADQLGRDILSRVIYGARTSLIVGVVATVFSGIGGLILGLLSGYFRGALEGLSMGAMDILLSFPALVLAIALTAVLGPGVGNVIVAIAILALPSFARIARAQALTIASREFVEAARSLGARHRRIVFREIAPNVIPTVAAYGFIIIAVAIVVEGSLSFLGLGVPRDIPTWGGMIAEGRSQLRAHPHISLIPSAVMFLTIFAFNTVGEKLHRGENIAEGL